MNESQRLPLLLRPLSTVCEAEKPGFAGSLVFLVLFRNRAFSHPPPLPSEGAKELSAAVCVKARSVVSRRRPDVLCAERRRRGGGRGTLRDAEAGVKGKGEAPSDDCWTASKCQLPK